MFIRLRTRNTQSPRNQKPCASDYGDKGTQKKIPKPAFTDLENFLENLENFSEIAANYPRADINALNFSTTITMPSYLATGPCGVQSE